MPCPKRPSKILITYLLLAAIWVLLFHLCSIYSYSDPSSIFYDPRRAYQPQYSELREKESDRFLIEANRTLSDELWRLHLLHRDNIARSPVTFKRYCVGIPSIRREKEQFLPRTLASLVEGLSLEQRDSIHMVVLLGDQDAKSNPIFGQTWLERLADEILFYGSASSVDTPGKYRKLSRKHIGQDHETSRNELIHHGYATLMTVCQSRPADYFVLVEDDIIASQNWFERLTEGLSRLEHSNDAADWLYLRLFYSETFLGWNAEEWPMYLSHCLSVYCIVLTLYLLVTTAVFAARGQRTRPIVLRLKRWDVLHLTFWTTSFMVLYFLAGRLTVSPHQPGIHEMPNYGCCAQGLVIPYQHLGVLQAALETPPHNLAGDSFIEEFANHHGLKKYAIVPSVFQHVGVRGSSDTGGSKKTTWNFSFEKTKNRDA